MSCSLARDPSNDVVDNWRVKSGCRETRSDGELASIDDGEGSSRVTVPEKCSSVSPRETGRVAKRGRGKLTRMQVDIAKWT